MSTTSKNKAKQVKRVSKSTKMIKGAVQIAPTLIQPIEKKMKNKPVKMTVKVEKTKNGDKVVPVAIDNLVTREKVSQDQTPKIFDTVIDKLYDGLQYLLKSVGLKK